jgi:TatD DNase family protein
MNLPFFNLHTHYSDPGNVSIVQMDEEIPNQWFSVGIHPWKETLNTEINHYFDQTINAKCLAIGEIGLDKLKGPSLEIQQEVFQRQIELSEKYELPVIIHCVKAWNELKVLKRRLKPTQPWIFHGFSKIAILDEVLAEGMHVSFGMRLLKDNSLLNHALNVPNDRVFLETDDAKIGIDELYSLFAKAKKIPLQELKEIQFRNFKRVFTKWKSG